jgi:CubicO group peptidase (beta-lactamase class C family)
MKFTAFLFLLLPILGVSQQRNYDFSKLDTFFDLLDENDKFMGSATVSIRGEEVYSKALGCRDCSKNIRNQKDTKYRIGSISKVFTAVLAFQEIEKGNLSLQQTLDKWFPNVPNASEITIDQLLNHHSGIYNFTNAPEYTSYLTVSKTRDEILNLISGYEPAFEPGTMGGYSNSNYVLLSMILEKITGKDYSKLVEERITKPLKLHNTYFGSDINISDNEAFSYMYQMGSWIKQPETDMSIPLGAGGIVSSASDLTSFIRALFNGELVSPSSLDQMKSIEDNYGRGLFLFPFYSKIAYGHNGGIDGFSSNVSYFPEEDIAISLLSNGVNYDMNLMSIAILSQTFDMNYDLPDFNVEEITLSEEELRKFEGLYGTSLAPMEIQIFIDNGALMAQATGQSSFPLSPILEHSFQFKPAGITIEFKELMAGQNEYQQFTLKQAGQNVPFERVP